MLAMAAVGATIETIQKQKLMDRAGAIFEAIKEGLTHAGITVRGRGCLIGLVLDGPAKPVIGALRAAGVLVGGAVPPNVIRVMPPLVASDAEVARFIDTTRTVLQQAPTTA